MTDRRRGQVSGQYAGAVSRFLAFLADWFLVSAIFGLILAALAFLVGIITDSTPNFDTRTGLLWGLAYLTWVFLYQTVSLGLTARTPGKGIVGLRVVNRDGSPLSGRNALVRVIAFPLSFLTLGIGFAGILVGRERRALHDVIAGTAVVYDWGDRPAEMPDPLTRWLEKRNVAPDSIETVSSTSNADAP